MGRLSKVKYLEELEVGDCFEFENCNFITLLDYKKNGNRCCANLKTGSTRWIEPNAVVNISPIYTLDKDNNIVALRETKKQDV